MADAPKNLAASVKQRLLNMARAQGRGFDILLVRFALARAGTGPAQFLGELFKRAPLEIVEQLGEDIDEPRPRWRMEPPNCSLGRSPSTSPISIAAATRSASDSQARRQELE